jgi:hypothetical protein
VVEPALDRFNSSFTGMNSVSETQLERILSAINTSHPGGWWQWVPVASVFVSALLAMLVGIGLESFKTWWSAKRSEEERQRKEIAAINVAISGITYNIETLLHATGQHILPHYEESHKAYTALCEAGEDAQKFAQLLKLLPTYRALVTICPQIYFVEWNFLSELSFIVEKDPELLKKSGWLTSFARALHAATRNRNDIILSARDATLRQGGMKRDEFRSTLQLQTSIADAECLNASQLFDILIDIERRLESINETYKIKARKSRITLPNELNTNLEQLHKIVGPTATQIAMIP